MDIFRLFRINISEPISILGEGVVFEDGRVAFRFSDGTCGIYSSRDKLNERIDGIAVAESRLEGVDRMFEPENVEERVQKAIRNAIK